MSGAGAISDRTRSARFILDLRTAGVTDPAILEAIEQTPREAFLSSHLHRYCYSDTALPLPCGQSTTPPLQAALMIQALGLGTAGNGRTIEIGTGSGWTTAVLGHLSNDVLSVERYHYLFRDARRVLDAQKAENIDLVHADGLEAHYSGAPFDRLIAFGACKALPDVWRANLKPGGIAVVPIITDGSQHICSFTRAETDWDNCEELAVSRFLPFVDGIASLL